MQIAILDDYQNVALKIADWSVIKRSAQVLVFNDHLTDEHALVERLSPFGVVCIMRKRTPLSIVLVRRSEPGADIAVKKSVNGIARLIHRCFHYTGRGRYADTVNILKINKPRDAERVYRDDLIYNPGNGWSQLGMHISLKAQKKLKEAKKYKTLYQQAFAAGNVKPIASVF
jgi:hypothetical protein